jgi:hypothetical protein
MPNASVSSRREHASGSAHGWRPVELLHHGVASSLQLGDDGLEVRCRRAQGGHRPRLPEAARHHAVVDVDQSSSVGGLGIG